MGLRVPTAQFSIHDVRACIGSQRIIDVMNVETQESQQMTMKSWTDYYDQPAEKRAKLLNVISLEFSHTTLEKYVESPSIVRRKSKRIDLKEFRSYRYEKSIGYQMHGQITGWIFKHSIRIISNKSICITRKLESNTSSFLTLPFLPRLFRYCLMSVGKCFTDFHIDMGA